MRKNQNDSEKKIKSFKSPFSLPGFTAEHTSFKVKEDFSLVYLFLTEGEYPSEEIKKLQESNPTLEIQHLVISPSGSGEMLHLHYGKGHDEVKSFQGPAIKMLGDLIQGGFK